MGRPAGWMRELTGKAPMKSPGKPSLRRDVERLFWREIARGLTSENPSLAVGVSQAAGSRWFRERGGMPSFLLAPITGRYLSFRSGKRSRCGRRRGLGCGRPRAGWVVTPRLSRGSCAAMQQPAAGSSTTGHRSRSGRQSCLRSVPRRRSLPRTSGCGNTCRSGWRGRSAARTGPRRGVR